MDYIHLREKRELSTFDIDRDEMVSYQLTLS